MVSKQDKKHMRDLMNEGMNLEPFEMFAEKQDIERRKQLAKQGVNAAPLLTIAWAILRAQDIPDTQALGEVIYAHEEILSKFLDQTEKK